MWKSKSHGAQMGAELTEIFVEKVKDCAVGLTKIIALFLATLFAFL